MTCWVYMDNEISDFGETIIDSRINFGINCYMHTQPDDLVDCYIDSSRMRFSITTLGGAQIIQSSAGNEWMGP